jgi:hypothetical protein
LRNLERKENERDSLSAPEMLRGWGRWKDWLINVNQIKSNLDDNDWKRKIKIMWDGE